MFKCIEYCESHDARLPTYKETHFVEKFKLQNEAMILNITANFGQKNSSHDKMTRHDCPMNSEFRYIYQYAPYLHELPYFVGIRMG